MTAIPRPDAPASRLVRAAQARLIAHLPGRDCDPTVPLDGVQVTQMATPWPGPLRAPAEPVDDERYEFGEAFAAGGLGLIRKARDRRLGRTIAVKELLRSDPLAERRFALEAAITARLQHPGIVPLYDIGRYPTGEPYYCMKLVEGQSLEHKIRACRGLAERLALLEHLIAAADAVAYAHRNHVIHRDLKPANILIGELGETVVIDWGLAKDLTGEVVEAVPDLPPPLAGVDSDMTQNGTVLGTLRYMPPEQARGLPADARSDVFSLGAVLHHILTGAPPHAELDDRRLVALVSEGAVVDLLALVPEAPRELVAIARRAMDPEPTRRYASAEALVDDLRRFLTGRLVGAHRYAPGEVLRLWLRRHRPAVAVASASLVALLGLGGYAVQNIRHQRDAATAAQVEAEAAHDATGQALDAARERANAAILAQASGALEFDLGAALIGLAEVDLSDETALRRVRLLAQAAESRGAPTRALVGHERPVARMVVLPGGDLVSVDLGGAVWRWDPRTGSGVQVLDLKEQHVVLIAAAEARVFAAVGAAAAHIVHPDGHVQVVDLAGVPRGSDRDPQYEFQLANDGAVLAALGLPVYTYPRVSSAPAYRWDLRRDPLVLEALPGERHGQATMSPDGREIAYEAADGPALMYADGVSSPMPGLSRPLGFSSTGRQVYGFPLDQPPRMASYDRDTGELHPLGRWVLSTAPGGAALAIGFDEFFGSAILSLRDLATGEERSRVFFDSSESLTQWGDHGDFAVAVDPAGVGLAVRSEDQWLLGDLASGRLDRSLDIGHHLHGIWLAGGGFAVAHNMEIWTWDPPASRLPVLDHAAVSPDGALSLAASEADAILQVWDLSSGTATASACLAGVTSAQASHPRALLAVDTGGRVLHSSEAGTLCVAAAGGPARMLALPDSTAPAPVVDPDGPPEYADVGMSRAGQVSALALGAGEQVAVGRVDGVVLTWQRPGDAPRQHQLGAAVARLTPVGAGHVAVTQEGVFATRDDGSVRDLVRVPPGSLYGARMQDTAIAVHPHAPVVAVVVPGEEALHLYDFASDRAGQRTLKLATPAVAYSPDGGRIAVAVAGRGLQVFADLDDPGRTLALPEEARSLAFVDPERLAVVGDRGSLICVDLPTGASAVCKPGFADIDDHYHVTLHPQPSGAMIGFVDRTNRVAHVPALAVPHDRAALGEWLQTRRAALGGE